MTDEFFDALKSGSVAGVLKKFRPVEEELEEANKIMDDIATALGRLTTSEEDDPCWADHHGYCQAHYLEPIEECSMKVARAVLTRYRERGK